MSDSDQKSDDQSPPKQSPEEIQADIAAKRDDLAATVSELQARIDVKARAKDKANDLKDRATTDTGKPRADLSIGAALAVVALIGLIVWRRRRR